MFPLNLALTWKLNSGLLFSKFPLSLVYVANYEENHSETSAQDSHNH